MTFWEILITGIALSMDAFAVSLCKGLSMRSFNTKHALIIGGFFGGFQALMPLIGWLLGTSFVKYIEAYDHWIAFFLLAAIGGKMIRDAVREMKEPEKKQEPFRLKISELIFLAIATSIDALAVGFTFALLDNGTPGSLSIWASIAIIGATTFIISIFGVKIGNRFGNRFEAKAQIAGGIILIAIGIKILLEHLL